MSSRDKYCLATDVSPQDSQCLLVLKWAVTVGSAWVSQSGTL